MRYLKFLSLTLLSVQSVLAVADADNPVLLDDLSHPPAVELVEESADDSAVTHLVVMGTIEKINHELLPEASELVLGRKYTRTWYLPQSRSTKRTGRFYLEQLEAFGELVFKCDGRSCGSSSYWARTMDRSILYGPEQYQRYYIVRLPDDGGYFALYVGQRATRKIYVHAEQVVPVKE